MGHYATPTIPICRSSFATGERRFLQHSESPELWQPDQLLELTTIRTRNPDAEQLPWQRWPERGPQSAVPNRRPALDPTRAQAAVLKKSGLATVCARGIPYMQPVDPTIRHLTPFTFLFCKSWMALINFRRERGLTVFFPFLNILIVCSASLAWRDRRFVENCFASARTSSRYFGSTTLSYSRKVSSAGSSSPAAVNIDGSGPPPQRVDASFPR